MRLGLATLATFGLLLGCGNDTSSPHDHGLGAAASGGEPASSSSAGTAGPSSGGAGGVEEALGGNRTGGNASSGGPGSSSTSGSSSGGAFVGTAGTDAGESGAGTGGIPTGGTGRPARGAVSLHVLAPSGCSLSEQFQDFPVTASGHPVDDATVTSIVENGQMSATGEPEFVLCTWGSTQPPFTVDGLIRIGVSGTAGERRIEITSTMAEGQPFNGNLVVRAAELPIGYDVGDAGPCVFTALEIDPEKRSVWGRFSCGGLDASDGTDHCAAGPSFFYFENCALR